MGFVSEKMIEHGDIEKEWIRHLNFKSEHLWHERPIWPCESRKRLKDEHRLHVVANEGDPTCRRFSTGQKWHWPSSRSNNRPSIVPKKQHQTASEHQKYKTIASCHFNWSCKLESLKWCDQWKVGPNTAGAWEVGCIINLYGTSGSEVLFVLQLAKVC